MTTASHMRWHAEFYCLEDGEMCHPSDSEAWLTLSATHPDFARETRNVRLHNGDRPPLMCIKKQYMLTPYNLPPLMCMKKQYMFLTVIVPDPNNPKHKIDLYLVPLMPELKLLWEDGIQTYSYPRERTFIFIRF